MIRFIRVHIVSFKFYYKTMCLKKMVAKRTCSRLNFIFFVICVPPPVWAHFYHFYFSIVFLHCFLSLLYLFTVLCFYCISSLFYVSIEFLHCFLSLLYFFTVFCLCCISSRFYVSIVVLHCFLSLLYFFTVFVGVTA